MSFKNNKYSSSQSVIIAGPGTMYNEVTTPKPTQRLRRENTNTYDVTLPKIKVVTKSIPVAKSNKQTSKKSNKTKK